MIAKCKAIAHGSNALEYVFREGKLGRILALHNLCGETPKEIHEEMRLINNYNSRCKNKFLRIEIGIAPQDEPRMTFKALNPALRQTDGLGRSSMGGRHAQRH